MASERYAVGVDLGGTSIKVGIVSARGKIVKKISLDTKAGEGPRTVIKQIKKGIASILSENKYKITDIGVGAPGSVIQKKGTVENPPNLPGWEQVPLGKILKKEFRKNVFVENDANAAAIGEKIFGRGKKIKNFIMVTLGTGVGGGLIINNKIYRGEMGAAGEIGHITIDHAGRKCNCGSYGCLETYVGINYLIKSVEKELPRYPNSKINDLLGGDKSKLSPKLIHEAAQLNDEYAKSVITEVGNALGYGLSSAVNLLDITDVIIGGGVAGFGEQLMNNVEATIKSRVLKPLRSRIKVRAAKLKNEAGIKGASAIVFYKS